MFMPVVKEAIRVRSADEIGPAVARAAQTALAPPARPVYVEIPTDLLDGDAGVRGLTPQPNPRPSSERVRPRSEAAQLERALGLLERARRPLIWAGGGALQSGAGEAVARLAERLVAPVILTFSAKGLAAAGPSVPRGVVAARARGGRAVGRGRRGGRDRQRPRRDDDPGLEAAPAAASRGDQRRPDRRVEELPAGRRGRGRRARRRPPPSRSGSASAAGSTRSSAGVRDLNRAVRERLASEEPGGERLPRHDRGRAARRRGRRVRHVHPRLLARRLPPHPGAAEALLPARLGHARLRVPAGARRGAGRTRARR